jgi:hypothetical protein
MGKPLDANEVFMVCEYGGTAGGKCCVMWITYGCSEDAIPVICLPIRTKTGLKGLGGNRGGG